MNPEIRLLKPEDLLREIPEEELKAMSLYNQPFFCEHIRPGKLRFGRMISGENKVYYFPLTTDRLLLQRRVFILPYCQRFTPFSKDKSPLKKQQLQAWTGWLERNSSTCHWNFSDPAAKGVYPEKINQFLNLNRDAQTLFNLWSRGRKSALSKSGNLQNQVLSKSEFRLELEKMNRLNPGKGWRPDAFEKAAILRISDMQIMEEQIERIGVFEGEKCLCLVFLFRWNNRWHYLFSQSSQRGFEKDALTCFFFHLIEKKAGSPNLFDFEGSSLPGVHSFFKSLGAEEENYWEFRKP